MQSSLITYAFALSWLLISGCSKELTIPTVEEVTSSMFSVVFEPSNQLSQRFLEAVKNGDAKLVADFVESSYDNQSDQGLFVYIDFKDENGWTPLLWAVRYNNIDIVKALVSGGANVDIRANDGATVLGIAAQQNSSEMVELLARKVREIDCVDGEGKTALMHAVLRSNFELVEELLRKDANVLIRDDAGFSSLDYARMIGDGDVYRRLQEELDVWREIGSTGDTAMYFKPFGGPLDSNQNPKLWIREIEETPEAANGVTNAESGSRPNQVRVRLVEISCVKRQLRTVQSFLNFNSEQSEPARWQIIIPGTIGESWFETACPFFVNLMVSTPNPTLPPETATAPSASAVR